jgi:hypothetical protein
VVRAARGTPIFDAIEVLLKGPEIPLGDGRSYVDKDGFPRTEARYRWWDPDATTLRRGAELPGGVTLGLPDDPLDVDSLPRYTDTTPVIYGHYWRIGTPSVETPVSACVDHSAAKGGDLVAYRWEGETTLRDDHFVAHPGEALLDEARAFIRDATWTFAVTMSDNPHWYVIRSAPDAEPCSSCWSDAPLPARGTATRTGVRSRRVVVRADLARDQPQAGRLRRLGWRPAATRQLATAGPAPGPAR